MNEVLTSVAGSALIVIASITPALVAAAITSRLFRKGVESQSK